MWHRSVRGATIAAGVLLSMAVPALAGGWAVATFDQLPAAGFRAGETYRLGYTVRQHGDKPFAGARTEIRVRSATTGELHAFRGVPEGAIGHYVAEVRFPASGPWSWEVTQEPFAPQQLGTVVVAAPATPASSPQASPATDVATLRLALPVATLLALSLFAQRLIVFVWQRRSPPALGVARVAGGSE